MELLVRGAAIYFALFLLMRLSGNRQFSRLTAFDAVLIILIAEVAGQALIGEDYSLTGAIVVLATIIGLDILLSLIKNRSKPFAKLVDGTPVLLIDQGRILDDVMKKERVEKEDILESARELRGIERLEDIKYAVLEPDGKISIIPRA